MTARTDTLPWAVYTPAPGPRDEAVDAQGRWRPHVVTALEGVKARDLAALSAAMADDVRRAGLRFPIDGGTEDFRVDPMPRVLTATEWETIETGVAQRARALDAFIADVHGPRRAVAEGVVPERVVTSAEHYEREADDLQPPAGVWAPLAGLDLVQTPQGQFQVLEDNVRTPSGIAYTLAARALLQDVLEVDHPPARALDGAIDLLAATLRAAAPPERDRDGDRDPDHINLVVLTDGPTSPAYWEHRALAVHLDAPLITCEELDLDARDRLVLRDAPQRPIDVVYRRTDSSSLQAPGHRRLRAALGAGTVGVVNAFGTGVADDKLTHAYVEDLIRFYLAEEPALRSVPTFDLEDAEQRAEALDRLDELVVKPRGGAGGHGVVICPHAERDAIDAVRAAIIEHPEQLVAQELVQISTHPTVVDGALRPRHVDLRPFGLTTPTATTVLPGGLSRVALREGSIVVNSSQDGGAKDTWVLTR
ncbi:MAG TPA: circularly permuted type 2 ATP-grasp protein [Baekduia sp.]|nr:circularly permuted type 2 ATP-grasp protein [Baekduia sp.]